MLTKEEAEKIWQALLRICNCQGDEKEEMRI